LKRELQQFSFVESVLTVTGCGSFLVCGAILGAVRAKIGARLEVRRGDGLIFASTIEAVEFLDRSWGESAVALLVRGLDKASVNVGDKIWLEQNSK
jgi:hypothetical protein